VSRTAPIIGGTPADDPAVVAVEIGGGLCTGTFLAPDLVLTAGHCVTGPGGTAGGAAITGAEVDPDADLALVFVDPEADRAVHAWSDASSDDVAEVRVLGVGQTDFGDPGSAGATHQVLLAVTGRTDEYLLVGDATMNTCQGDSGGPAFAGDAIVAVVSFGDVGCEGTARLVRLDAEAAWLAEWVAPEPTGCCSAGGDPAGAALLAAAAYAALVVRRSGRRCSGRRSISSGSTISPRQVGAPQLHGSAIDAANA
jgi:hypothetical protein